MIEKKEKKGNVTVYYVKKDYDDDKLSKVLNKKLKRSDIKDIIDDDADVYTEDGKLLLAALAIMMFSNLSTITSYMFGVAVSFALLISYCRVKIFLKHNYKGSTHT